MLKIVLDKGIFRIKQVDQEGNSLRMLPEEFTTEEAAQAFMDSQENKPEQTQDQATDTANETNSAGENTPADESADAGEQSPE